MPIWPQPTDAPLGRGLTSAVYAYGAGRALKLFHPKTVRERVEREFSVARAIHAAGAPAPAVFDVLERDGRVAIVMERVTGVSLLQRVQRRPWSLFAAVRELAACHVAIHRLRAPASLPTHREAIADRLAAASTLTDQERRQAREWLAELPDGDALCHGDFHPENVLLTARGPVVLDWSRASRGLPASDAACTSLLLQHASLPDAAPRYLHGLLAAFRHRLHGGYLRAYTRAGFATVAEIAAWERPLLLAR